jgi:hypothetical protein
VSCEAGTTCTDGSCVVPGTETDTGTEDSGITGTPGARSPTDDHEAPGTLTPLTESPSIWGCTTAPGRARLVLVAFPLLAAWRRRSRRPIARAR